MVKPVEMTQILIDHGLVSKDVLFFPKTPDDLSGNFFGALPQRNYHCCFPKKTLSIDFIHH